jgi:hypothetical protein
MSIAQIPEDDKLSSYTAAPVKFQLTCSGSNIKNGLWIRINWCQVQSTFGDQHHEVVLHILSVHFILEQCR